MKTQLGKLSEIFNAQTTAPPQEPKSVPREVHNKAIKRDKFDGNRLRGIPELQSNNRLHRYEHELKELKTIAKRLKVTCTVADLNSI